MANGQEASARGFQPMAIGQEASARGFRPMANGQEASARGFQPMANGEWCGSTLLPSNSIKYSHLDDADRTLIALKANQVSYAAFGIGFLLAMISLASGLPPLVMFHLIVFSLFGAGIVGYVTQLYLYRRGF